MPQLLLAILLLAGYLVMRTEIMTRNMIREASETQTRVCAMLRGQVIDMNGNVVANATGECDEIIDVESAEAQ